MAIILDRSLNNKVVLITGGAERLGAMTARYCHAAGAKLIIHYRQSSFSASALEKELNQQRQKSVALLQADILDEKKITTLITKAVSIWGQLDVLVNNASSFYPTKVGETTEAQWHDLMGTNLKAPYFLSQAAATYLRKQQGCIVNIVDIHAQKPMANHSVYNMAKAGLAMQVKTLARELGPDIRVNGVAPGAILWPQNNPDFSSEDRQNIINNTFLKRQGGSEDIARTVLFLIKDADYITGQIISVDGGRELFI